MWPFGTKAKLVRALDSLAFYNDKGIAYARHSPEQVELDRTVRLAKIHDLVATLGAANLPQEFLAALDSGDLVTDLTGQYAIAVRAHLRSGSAL